MTRLLPEENGSFSRLSLKIFHRRFSTYQLTLDPKFLSQIKETKNIKDNFTITPFHNK